MRKITKSLLALALLFGAVGGVKATKLYATYGTPADKGSWNAETGVYSWTESNSNLMDLFTFDAGQLANYESLHFTTSDYVDGPYRVCFMTGSTVTATIAFYSAGEKNLVLSERTETKDLDLSQITSIKFGGASGSGSVKITSKPYLRKPTTISYDETGICVLDPTEIEADVNLTYNDQTGEMTSAGNGTFSIVLDDVDFSSVTKIELLRSGDDIVQTLQITDDENGVLNTWYGSKYNVDFTGYQGQANRITKLAWNCNTAGTMTITGVRITSSVITSTPGNEVAVGTLERKYFKDETWKTGSVTTVYGTGIETPMGDGNATQDEYVDLADYSELRLYVSSGEPRLFMVKESDFTPTADGYILTKDGVKQNGQWGGVQDTNHKLVKKGDYYCISVSDIKAACGGQAKLIGVKAEYSQTLDITNIVVVDPSRPYSYTVAGKGPLSSAAIAALADANATAIDATGITATTQLIPTNPNCFVVAETGMVTGAFNIIVSDACAQLAISDGYPFKAPAAFTATAAPTYDRAFAASTTTTVCLPFALTAAEAATLGTFYELSSVDGSTLHFTSVDAPEANKAYLVVPTATGLTLSETGKSIAATPADLGTTVSGVDFIGTLAATTIPASDGSYSYYAYNNGSLVKITTNAATLPAFRGYFKVAGASARSLNISLDNEATGISTLLMNNGKVNNEVYNLKGQRVSQPTKGLYIVNGKKVVK